MENFTAVKNAMRASKRTHDENTPIEGVIDWRPLNKAMLLSTTYSLNASSTKMVTIGIALLNDQDFEVALKFSSRCYSTGISLTRGEWRELCTQMTTITRWFNDQSSFVNEAPPTI